jgi:NAD(P)-dependent dehydrogenase (short-subunit alcohol dehydrogenase family)
MPSTLILNDKHAVIFGAGGSIGAAVAKAFAAEGAEVFLSGRTKANVEAVAQDIAGGGGRAHVAVVDALDDTAVESYVDGIVKRTGKIDVVLNAVGPLISEYNNGTQALDLSIAQFMVPLTTIVKSQFITARATARHMVQRRSGVIIFLTGSPARGHANGTTAIGAAFGAVETLMENLAMEVSPTGVRTVCLRTTANVDSTTIRQTTEAIASRLNVPKDQMTARLVAGNLLKQPATVADTARAAVLIASDNARMMTGTVLNVTAGAAPD